MPYIKIKDIHSFSSEDTNNPAKNLLGNDPIKKWKCSKNGEKSAFIVFELEKQTKITEIIIGNECSAFIEVLVAKKGPSELIFQEIILTSSFMTPYESRNTSNCNRVRNFSSPALIDDIAKEKWDLIKLICTQPFNRHIKYGISFVKLYTKDQTVSDKKNEHIELVIENSETIKALQTDNTSDNNTKGNKILQLGRFNVREESSDSDSDVKNSLFNRWKLKNDITSTASAIREASSSPSLINKTKALIMHNRDNNSENITKDENHPNIKDRNHNRLMYDEEDDKPNEKLENKIARDKKKESSESSSHSSKKHHSSSPSKHSSSSSSKRSLDDSTSSKTKPSPSVSSHSSSSSNSHNHRKRSASSSHSHEATKKTKISPDILYKPFNKLLENVIFVISGLQNPERGQIRQQALEMGAKYKTDWDSHCTHLICAFKNTPKYNQVKGKGIIVKKDWITACYSQQKKLFCQNFVLDKHDKNNKFDNDPEIYDIKLKPKEQENNTPTVIEIDVDYSSPVKEKAEDESDDTEDEIERVLNNNNKIKEKVDLSPVYCQSTEEDETIIKSPRRVEEKLFFNHKKFYINETSISTIDLIKLKRFIPLYKGKIIDNPKEANYVITEDIPTEDSVEHFNGEFIRPLWIFECNDMEALIPIQRYTITKNT